MGFGGCGSKGITNLDCQNGLLTWVDEKGAPQSINLAECLPELVGVTNLNFSCDTCNLTWIDQNGNPGLADMSCLIGVRSLSFNPTLKAFVYFEGKSQTPKTVDVSSLCSTFDYFPQNHSVIHNGVPHQLNCGKLDFNPATCQLTYTDEKGVVQSYFIPQDQFIYDAVGCQLTILSAKSGQITFPVGVPATDVSFQMLDNKVLEFKYKDKKCQVTLPNSMVGCEYNPATNTLRLLYCDGTFDEKALAKASLTCNTLDDGTQVLVFQDGCGGQKMFNIPAVSIDLDFATLVGSVLTLTYGGDGNPSTTIIDLCQVIGDNCNAHFTSINPDGSWTFIDNKGQTFTYPAPANCCTFHGLNTAPLDPAAPPAQPAGNYPAKQDRDTLIECHPNGLSFWTCVAGAWSFDFMKLAAEEIFIGPGEPPKTAELKAWFNPVTCVVKYCDNDGNWLQPTNLICQEDEPDTAKGNYTHWYKPSTCCYSILCDGVWVGVNGVVMNDLITALCVQVGNSLPIPLEVVEGKVIIPVPAPIEPPEVCVRIGGTDQVPIVPHADAGDDSGKLYLDLPPYPELPEIPPAAPGCCHYNQESTQALGGADALTPPTGTATKNPGDTVLLKHPNGFSAWVCGAAGWALDWVCPLNIPQLYTYCYKIGDDEPVAVNPVNGKIEIPIPATADPFTFCYKIGDAEPVDITPVDGKVQVPIPAAADPFTFCYKIGDAEPVDITPVDGKIQIPIPAAPNDFDKTSLFSNAETQPPTDGSQGCFWLDTNGCPHILFGTTWIATNGSDTAAP